VVIRSLLAAAWLVGFSTVQALANPKLAECREFGMQEFSGIPGFKTLELKTNDLLFEDDFNRFTGSQYVNTVIHGEGNLVLASGASPIRFVCLHAGAGKGPVFFYIMPAN
jgi:hypothetical protein